MYEQPFNPFAANLAVVKGYFKNGKVLTMGILSVVSAIVTVVSTAMSAFGENSADLDVLRTLSEISPDLARMAESYMMMSGSQTPSIVSVAFSALFSAALIVLVAAAYFNIYVKSKNDDPQSTPYTGVNILYVLSVISLVVMIIGVVIAVLVIASLLIFAFYLYDQYGEQLRVELGLSAAGFKELTIAVAIAGSVFLVIAIIYGLLMVVNRKRFYGSVRASLTTVELQNKGAKVYGVMCIITSIFLALGILGSAYSVVVALGVGFSAPTVISAVLSCLGELIAFLTVLFEGRIALGYKKYIDEQKYGYNGTPYSAVQDGGFVPPTDNGANPYAAPQQPYNDSYANLNTAQQPTPAYRDQFVDYGAKTQAPARPMICPNCGAPLEENSAFCGNCGSKL